MKWMANSMTWTEPSAVRKAYCPTPLFPLWSHIVFGAIVCTFMLIAFFVRVDDSPGDKLIGLALGVGLGLLGGYGIPLLDGLGGATIFVDADGIMRMDSHLGYNIPILLLLKYRCRRWKWADIAGVNLRTEQFKKGPIQILEIVGRDDESLGIVGLPKKFKMDKLLAILAEHHCPIETLENLDTIEGQTA